MKYLLLILTSIILTISCSEDDGMGKQTDGDGVIISLPYEWKKSLHKNGVASNGQIDFPIYYKDNIVIPTTDGKDNRLLTMINTTNGETLWQWNDSYLPYSSQIIIFYQYQYNNLLTYTDGGATHCINLDNGASHWRIKRNVSFHSKVSGFDNNYFTFGESESKYLEYQERIGYKGNIETGEIEEYIIPNFTLEHIVGNRIGDVTEIEPYMFNGTQHLAVTWQELTHDNLWNFQTYLGLYNYETNEWVYEKKIMNEPNLNGVVLAPPIIYQDKIYANIGHQLVCHDLATGDQVWIKDFPQDFSFSGFIIEDGKIIANNEDTFTYALNPDNGSQIWKTETSGTSGRMSYLNGIVYFVGGSSDKLHAIDVNTGKHVWKLDNGNFKTNAVYVLPAKNGELAKVIALTHSNVYCFEAFQ